MRYRSEIHSDTGVCMAVFFYFLKKFKRRIFHNVRNLNSVSIDTDFFGIQPHPFVYKESGFFHRTVAELSSWATIWLANLKYLPSSLLGKSFPTSSGKMEALL